MIVRRVLVGAPLLPEYDRESGSRRIYHLLEFLREAGCAVTFIAEYGDKSRAERYLRKLRQLGVNAQLGFMPEIDEIVAAGHFDLAIFAFWYLAERCIPTIRRLSPRTRVIVDSIDLHFVREARQVFLDLPANHTGGQHSHAFSWKDGASLHASPNPIPAGFRTGTTTITWSTGGDRPGQIYVSEGGSAEKLFAQGHSGSAEASWISNGKSYEFRLYEGTAHRDLLAAVTVTMETGSIGLDSTYASNMIREINSYAASDGVLTVSQKEAALLADLVGDPSLAHPVPDGEELSPSAVPLSERKGILFVGNFRHAPNARAVEYLCSDILPRLRPSLRDEHPVYVVGNALDDSIRRYARGLPGVRMIGWVPSVLPYFERARITVIPLLYGAGTKRKLVQALMIGTPSVSTSVGAEGLNLQDGEHILIADDPATFANAITRLLEDSALWLRLAQQGRLHATAAHGRKVASEALMQAIASVLAREPKRPVLSTLQENAEGVPARDSYQQLVERLKKAVHRSVPPGATVLVVSKGDDAFLSLGSRNAWHFPQTLDRVYAGHHPLNSDEAITHLERLREEGATHLVFPETARWWLEHYAEFARHLQIRYREALREEDTCTIFDLRERTDQADEWGKIDFARDEVVTPVRNAPPIEKDVKILAFYLPQFYPTPETDARWGEGFTAWRTVVTAVPLFPGHYQPQLPADLGFCDLRLPEVRQAQADLADEYGIFGFCYNHYWKRGTALFQHPFYDVLKTGHPDFPFCLCWSPPPRLIESTGDSEDVLGHQRAEDDIVHIRSLLPALADPRAIAVDGKPLFLVHSSLLSNAPKTIDTWRDEVYKAGLEGIYLVGVMNSSGVEQNAATACFDAVLSYQPQLELLVDSEARMHDLETESLQVYDYHKAWRVLANQERAPYRQYDTVFPAWDDSPVAQGKKVVFHNSTPSSYEEWLRQAVRKARTEPEAHRFVFINAWNGWPEGCHLEPDLRFGRTYLEATRRALLPSMRTLPSGPIVESY